MLCLLLLLQEITNHQNLCSIGSYYDALGLQLRSSNLKLKSAEAAVALPPSSSLDIGRGQVPAVPQGMGSGAAAAALAISRRIMGEERGEGEGRV